MKKIISSILLSVLLVATLLSLVSCGGPKFEFELNEDGESYKLVGMENAKGDVAIPATYNDLPVTKIGKNSVYDKPRMTSLVLPDSITEIEGYAFSGNLNGLESITIGKNVLRIGDYALAGSAVVTTEINYCGSPEQWKELCRYYKGNDGETEFTKIYDEDAFTVNYNYVMPE